MRKWEYCKTLGDMDQGYLDNMGDQGWELVGWNKSDSNIVSGFVMIWKRERPGTNSTLVEKKKPTRSIQW